MKTTLLRGLPPQIMAATLAKYSRSNSGIEAILAKVDLNDPDAAKKILAFADYGHASIADLTGTIPITLDGISMFAAYKIFELAQQGSGQESSTRYITMDESALLPGEAFGLSESHEFTTVMGRFFSAYHNELQRLTEEVRMNPSCARIPDSVTGKKRDRMLQNYGLDRARYFLPFATRTNMAIMMTARAWAQTLRDLESLPYVEAKTIAQSIRTEIAKEIPDLLKHSVPTAASLHHANNEFDHLYQHYKKHGFSIDNCQDQVYVHVDGLSNDELPPWDPRRGTLEEAVANSANRYDAVGIDLKRAVVRLAWNNMAIAELRDLNRHRTGHRYSLLTPVGFYLPSEIDASQHRSLLEQHAGFVEKTVKTNPRSLPYLYLLGTQVPFEHSTHGDKANYTIQLRTGLGAHFRYAEHMRLAHAKMARKYPELACIIPLGTAEPEAV